MSTKKQLRYEILELVKQYYQASKLEESAFEPGISTVRYAGRVYGAEELVNLVDSSLDFWLTAGRYAEEFEGALADYLGTEYSLLVNSGSSANLVAFSSLTSPTLKDRRLRAGDEVITAAAGFPTTVNPIIQNQALPVFVDVELGTYVPTLESIERAITSKTKAIMLAHTMGVPYPVKELRELCDAKKIWLVEDNCDALGTKYDNKYTSSWGHLGTLSFYPAHHITMGEGGAVITSDETLARAARSIRDWGRDCYCNGGENNTCGRRFSQHHGTLPYGYDHKYVYSHIGYNLKVTDMQAAIGVAQLQRIVDFVNARKENHSELGKIFAPYQDSFILHSAIPNSDPSWFGYVLTVKSNAKFSRMEFVNMLEGAKIETRNLFCGNLLRHPAYVDIPHRVAEPLVNTDIITMNTFFIGVSPVVTKPMIAHIATSVDSFMAKYGA